MPEVTQSYANHRRFLPAFHFFAVPILGINVIVTIVHLAQAPSALAAWQLLVALALLAAVLSFRWMVTRAQDRMIREEERLRLTRLLPEGERLTVDTLTLDQLIALRFAPDSEVVALARRCSSGELVTRDGVKRAVQQWRPDSLRV
jgi:hypothetical protein